MNKLLKIITVLLVIALTSCALYREQTGTSKLAQDPPLLERAIEGSIKNSTASITCKPAKVNKKVEKVNEATPAARMELQHELSRIQQQINNLEDGVEKLKQN
jgi:flagellar capping protein FliD